MFLFIILSACYCSNFSLLDDNAVNCPSRNGTVGDYRTFMYASFWLGTQCVVDSPGSGIGPVQGTNLVTLHGLWAQNDSTTYPTCCDNTFVYDPSAVADIPDLEKNWVSTQGTNDKFYKHEWEKHGTCAMDLYSTQRKYFEAVVATHKHLDLANVLLNNGIVPGSTKYARAQVKNAIYNSLGVEPLLQCQTKKNQSMLSSIVLCMTHSDPPQPVPCSEEYFTLWDPQCPDNFTLPLIPDTCYQ